ncbi:MAG: hypothetical protein QXX59_08675 [Candidatus Bathyarchaeia archaeon]
MNTIKIKIDGKILTWLLIGILIGVLIPLSISYVNNTTSKTEAASEEGNTTIIRVYREYRMLEPVGGVELYQSEIPYWYYLDVEHRLYPESIVVPPKSHVDLGIDYTCNILGSGEWNVQPSDNVKCSVEVPRLPSNCSIETWLDTVSDTYNREFYVVITFTNPNNESWNVGRPLVTILGMTLGYSSDMTMPEVEVIIETSTLLP